METLSRDRPLTIWAMSDGRAGNRAQSLGLAEALARRVPARIVEKTTIPGPRAAKLPARIWHMAGKVLPGWPEAGLAEGRASLEPPWPDLVIGAGRRVAPIVAALGRRHGCRTVQLLDPQMPLGAFDRVVAPAHDDLTGANVLTSVGSLGRLTPERIGAAAGGWAKRLRHLAKPRLAVLIGGSSRSAPFLRRDQRHLVASLERLSGQYGIMATLSRRTPSNLGGAIAWTLGERHFLWNGDGDNPYPGILGLADAVLVTADSVNMACEAASSGLPVHIFPMEGLAPKLRRFHADLEARGASRPFEGRIRAWEYRPLAEADRIAQLLLGG